jgi:xylulokinase
MRAGLAYNISGTTEVLGLVTDRQAETSGLLTVDWGEHLTQIGGPSQCGGDTLRWLLDLVQGEKASPESAIAALLTRERDAEPLLFIPYLQGERVPHWDPSLRGAFLGLNRRHGPADLAHAVLEGIACLNRSVLEAAEAAAGMRALELRLGGGGARNRLLCDIKASVLGREVTVPDCEEPGLLGAAVAARTALGAYLDLAAAQSDLVPIARRHAPDPRLRETYDQLYELFRTAERAIAPISSKLSRLTLDKPGRSSP